ncbi:MAG: OmpA family protein [Chitinispirillia bacterium]|jgi:outer membrane protein OmpA-like peptidoglycan-associated protein
MIHFLLPKAFSLLLVMCNYTFGAFDTEGQKGVIRTISAKTFGPLVLNMGIGFTFAQDKDYIKDVYIDNIKVSNDYGRMLTGLLSMSIGATSFLDFAGSLPIFYDKTGIGNGVRDGGIGDLSLSAKFLYPPPGKPRLFYQGFLLSGSIPSGNKSNGIFPRYTCFLDEKPMRGTFYTTDCFTFKPMILWTFDIGSITPKFQLDIDLNIGGLFSIDTDRNNTIFLNFALYYTPVDVFSIFIDWSVQSRWQNFERNYKWGSDPIMLSPGIRLNTPVGLHITFSGDFGLLTDLRGTGEFWAPDHKPVKNWKYKTAVSPKTGFQFVIGWNGPLTPQDSDNDGFQNEDDRCPKDPEDVDGYEDNDGCPELDNDKDDIPDLNDKCPNKREDIDGFEDSDGCPDSDNDGDGITDIQDRCPGIPEDFDGIEDSDGCPDSDNDKDGIQDSTDNCPNEPEDKDGYQDEDGCLDPDNDKDGIPDLKDRCPNDPETINGQKDEDGCPDKLEIKQESNMPKHQILEGVNFSSGSTNLSYSSYTYLEPIIREMKKFPEIEIEIRGHTDSIGKYNTNMNLSKKRAESVKQYLLKNGIHQSRIRSVGYGPSSPIADNRTASGRAKNRRIEIIRIK